MSSAPWNAAPTSSPERIKRFLWRQYYRYLLITGVYGLYPSEAFVFYCLVLLSFYIVMRAMLFWYYCD
jgi:hypothetical protein